jgi:hypothetical protein
MREEKKMKKMMAIMVLGLMIAAFSVIVAFAAAGGEGPYVIRKIEQQK